MTVVGALTTTFRAPSSCTTTTPQLYQVWSESESHYVEGPLFTSDSGCFPSGYDPAPTNYYSPGWCPYGYTTGCSSLASAGTVTETAVICCPTNFDYTCQASTSSGQSLIECTTAWSAAQAVLGVTVVADGEVGTTTVVTEPSNTITAHGIQVRFKSTDPTPVPKIDDPGFLVISRTPPLTISSHLAAPTQFSSSSDGVSTPAAIGIGVGSAIAALLIAGAIGLFFFLRWRRKSRSRKRSSIPPPVPPKELSASPLPYRAVPPPFELSNEAASPRRPSTSISKRHLSMSPAFETTPTMGVSRDSVVPAGCQVVELEAPSEASLRDRASPESESSGWTDRQARGATMPMPWI
ncbi:uncharacterized protein B0H64DRAFT_210423 [Chaetomium fimeti]|uniref:Uncharacterized protein n=1 Tax=Chaetomium fimeti TaxID=1854472 RepID=A0AAE0LQ47_9PEZI|nr:hypothetical protein B0H64DRAFT_210423 [Chaetomium fimeti]